MGILSPSRKGARSILKVLWIDTETTGLDPQKHGIFQIAWIIDIDGEIRDRGSLLFNPHWALIDPVALGVNKRTEDEIRGFQEAQEAFDHFISVLNKYINPYDKEDKFIVGGYNIDFDLGFLVSWAERMEFKYLFSYLSHRTIDPFKALGLLQWLGYVPTTKKANLATVCETLGVSLDNAHDAMADIEATRNLSYKIKSLLNPLDKLSL
jgi:DNA polymerase-3 subunit epsilon